MVTRNLPVKLQDCFGLLSDSVLALQRENKEILWGSMVKETMKRKKPSFNEGYYGFRTFSHLLEDAQKRGIVKLRRDQRSGSYIIEDLGQAVPTDAGAAAPAAPAEATASADSDGAKTPTRRRRSRGGRRTRGAATASAGAENGGGAGRADDGDDEVDAPSAPAPSPEAPRASQDRAAATDAPERGSSFSLFSWLRRDPEGEGTEGPKKP